tara:strand:- start:660 stop:1049 length:390 start_codon:yes stop_codon:yes gene_type:complete
VKNVLILLAVLIALIPHSINAQVKVSDFLIRCERVEFILQNPASIIEKDRREFAWCAGFVSGILDGYNTGVLVKGDLTFAKSVSICPPEGITDVHALLISLRELRILPQKLNRNAATVLSAILSIKWPC